MMTRDRRSRPRRPRKVAAARAPAARSAVPAAASALRRSREALTDIQGQLDEILGWLANPRERLDASTPDRLASSARRAEEALGALTALF